MATLAHLSFLYDWRFGALFGAAGAWFVVEYFLTPLVALAVPEGGMLDKPWLAQLAAAVVVLGGTVALMLLWPDIVGTYEAVG